MEQDPFRRVSCSRAVCWGAVEGDPQQLGGHQLSLLFALHQPVHPQALGRFSAKEAAPLLESTLGLRTRRSGRCPWIPPHNKKCSLLSSWIGFPNRSNIYRNGPNCTNKPSLWWGRRFTLGRVRRARRPQPGRGTAHGELCARESSAPSPLWDRPGHLHVPSSPAPAGWLLPSSRSGKQGFYRNPASSHTEDPTEDLRGALSVHLLPLGCTWSPDAAQGQGLGLFSCVQHK